MASRTTWIVMLSVSLGLTLAPVLALALDPAPMCEAGKLKEVGKYAYCRLKAESVAVKKGLAPDYSKCVEKFSGKWTKLEAKGAGQCPTEGDYAETFADATLYSDAVTACLGGPCPSRICHGLDRKVCVLTGLAWAGYPGVDACSACAFNESASCLSAMLGDCLTPADVIQCNADVLVACPAECCGEP